MKNFVLVAVLAISPQNAEDRYRAAAETHSRCDDDALTWVASLDSRTLAGLSGKVRVRTGAGNSESRRWRAETVASAIVMHTRIAASMWRIANDGGNWRVHVDHARALTRLIAEDSQQHSWLPAWFSVAASHFIAGGNPWSARQVLDDAPSAFESHSLLVLARGALNELLASDRVSPAARNLFEGQSRIHALPDVSAQQRKYREAAIRLYGQVVAADPTDAEARVRLAYLLSVLGRIEEAQSALEGVTERAELPAALAYYASLITGRVREQRGDFAGAETVYRAAEARFPRAQTPAIALAHLHFTSGSVTAARAGARELLARGGPDEAADDPWSAFGWGQHWRTADLLRDMLASVTRCGS